MATPTDVLLDRLQTLLATDATTLAPAANALKVHLAKAPFTPGPTLTVASFTEANFTGFAAKSAGLGACQQFTDAPTGQRVIQLNEPAGGWHWQPTDALNLPQTIYGYFVTELAGTILYGSALLTNPVTLTAANQGVDIPQVRFNVLPGALV